MGIKGLQKNSYDIADVDYYTRKVTLEYNRSLDRSNGRWIRNFNQKLLAHMSRRVTKDESSDFNTITREDLEKMREA